jgi:hypothetical protein
VLLGSGVNSRDRLIHDAVQHTAIVICSAAGAISGLESREAGVARFTSIS